VADTPAAIIYAEAVRGLQEQEASVDGLRVRTGTLLAAASLITAFLGSQALAHAETVRVVAGQPLVEARFGPLSWIAVGCFIATAVLSLIVLWPWTWIFVASPTTLIEEHVEVDEPSSAHALQLFLARAHEENWESNARQLQALFWLFRAATLSLAAEVFIWVLALSTSS